MKSATIYCDGGAIGNPGPGGWAAVILLPQNNGGQGSVIEIGGGDMHTTNNRMELKAAIELLKFFSTLTPSPPTPTIHTDSKYVVNGITKWVFGWEKNGWRTANKQPVLNQDLWQELIALAGRLDVIWQHVRGHSGVILNERVDTIANSFARGRKVKLFSGDEKEYKIFLESAPKSAASKSGKAYSYVSMIDGKIMTHKTWAECEQRVKGKIAKFKKALSAEDEVKIIADFKKL